MFLCVCGPLWDFAVLHVLTDDNFDVIEMVTYRRKKLNLSIVASIVMLQK